MVRNLIAKERCHPIMDSLNRVSSQIIMSNADDQNIAQLTISDSIYEALTKSEIEFLEYLLIYYQINKGI